MTEPDEKRLLVLGKLRSILDCFTPAEPVLNLAQIRKRCQLPESTCQRLVQNLVREGFLDRDGGEYRVGLAMTRWALSATAGLDIVQASRPVLLQLRAETQESAVLYLRWRNARTVAATAKSTMAVSRVLEVGTVIPIHLGSGGKVFLAYDDAALADLRENAPDAALPAGLVEDVRRRGWWATFEEREREVSSVSAPVFDRDGRICAVLGIVAPISRLNERTVDPLYSRPVVRAAAELSERLGFLTVPSRGTGGSCAAIQ